MASRNMPESSYRIKFRAYLFAVQGILIPPNDAQLIMSIIYLFKFPTSGESMSLSVSERKQILEKWVAHGRPQSSGGPGLKVIAHIGAARYIC